MQNEAQSLILVEDEPLISIMIEELLQDLGWTVDGSAHTEADALTLLGTCSPRLALLDINLGLTTSLAVAASCRDRQIPVLFMTGYTARDVPPQCGEYPVLAKPFSPDALDQALRRALRKDRDVSPALTPN
jgi:DNA-binding response OmpR family regulator